MKYLPLQGNVMKILHLALLLFAVCIVFIHFMHRCCKIYKFTNVYTIYSLKLKNRIHMNTDIRILKTLQKYCKSWFAHCPYIYIYIYKAKTTYDSSLLALVNTNNDKTQISYYTKQLLSHLKLNFFKKTCILICLW